MAAVINGNGFYYTYDGSTAIPYDYNSIPSEAEEAGVEPIMGNPKGARYLISYAFKEAKDPVVFLSSKKELMEELEKLMSDDHVDQKTILVHEISNQYKPRKSEIELVKQKRK